MTQDQDIPRDCEPGGRSTPQDTADAGAVGLPDRVGEKGAPGSNQGRAEPIPPTQGHPAPAGQGQPPSELPALEPPSLADMNVGDADPQRPSLGGTPAATAGADRGSASGSGPASDGAGTAPAAVRPERLAVDDSGTGGGPAEPPGVGHRGPGLQGTPSPAERVDTDVAASAAAMDPAAAADAGQPTGAGDPRGVEVPSGVPSPGTSEQAGAVQGARTPAGRPADDAVDGPAASTT